MADARANSRRKGYAASRAIRIRLVAAGYEPVEAAAVGAKYQFDFKRAATLPPGMLHVPAGYLNERIAGIGLLNVARLEELDLDR
jgi:hypothetical protein